MIIRPESQADQTAVRDLNGRAFDTPAEATLVDALRAKARPLVSLVAVDDDRVIGHIMFSPVTLPGDNRFAIAGLAPMAVAPERQRVGVGSALVRAGLDVCATTGFGAVVVLGHPDYYPRFGFTASTSFGIKSEYDVPDDVFMAIELQTGHLQGASGTVKYHAAFSDL